MKRLYLLLLLSSACGRIGVDVLPAEDASVSNGGKQFRTINTHEETIPDSGTLSDASMEENDAGVSDAGVRDGGTVVVDAGLPDSSVTAPDASALTLDGTWTVQLAKTSSTCTDAVNTYEDLWTIENNASELHSADYDLLGSRGTFSAIYVNAKVVVNVQNMNGVLIGTHRLDALNANGIVRCTVTRSVQGVRD